MNSGRPGALYRGAMTRPTRRELLVDGALAVVVGAAAIMLTGLAADGWASNDRLVDAFAWILIGIAFGALVVRRWWPLFTLVVTTVATSTYLIATYPYGPILAAFFIAVYTVASRYPLRTSGISVAMALVVLLSHVFVHPSALGGLLGLIPGSAWAVVPFALGTTVRLSRQATEAARAEAIRQQLYEERIRLAQEVHDIVGHGLAAIQIQADVALHVDEQQAPRTRAALESISQASAEAFEELRTTLDLVSGTQSTNREPVSPGLGDIDELCKRMRGAGVNIELDMARETRPIPPAVDLAAYRVIQESLTNVIRHGAEHSARIAVTLDDEDLGIRITNPGPAAETATEGRGIRGMRRRVEALGGSLSAGATREGFEVSVRLPVRDRE
jgi:signal transduction histidine kinase